MTKLVSSALVAKVREIADDLSNEKYYGHIPTGEYDAGFYVMYGRASCIMGRALEEMNVKLDDLVSYENKKISKVVKDTFSKYTMSDLLWLDVVQRKHDTNYSYAESIALADQLLLGV